MALSKNLLGGTTEPVWGESRNFFHLLAMGTENELVVRIVELVCTISMSANELVLKLTRQEREVLFAYHVKILHALRERDGREAGRLARNYILHLGRYTEKYEHVRMKDSVYRAIREQEEEWETR
jgi:GntR family transcriptional repressor for pyruvate dehydrogenase complex